ncbi:permease prefix domain 1-containing protein [Actinoplanes sp. NPDC089786]|uniref:permease prefix domain 1-containing protein n=1 Tax=Actinoplanes sp. NPDC089786 TaxID=3155185 RepID=UPI003428123B
MTTLIDRYVFTVLRRVPERQRPDIDRELRASIADAVEARVEAGETADAATEATLRELGDPDRLADGYADRPQYLIGPELFPVWRRLITLFFATVLPIVVVVSVVVQVLDEATFGDVIGTAVSAAITTAAHLAFWTTGVFALLERTGVDKLPLKTGWTLDDLPKYEPGFLTSGQLAANLVWPVLLIVGLVLQPFAFTEVPVLDPAGWSFWWPYLIVILLLECVYALWLFRRGAWTHTVTAVNALLALLSAGPLIWLLASERFFNPEFITRLDSSSPNPLNWLTWTVIASVAFTAIFDVVDTAIKAERARRGLAKQIPGTAPVHM